MKPVIVQGIGQDALDETDGAVATEIKDRLSEELVIAFIGPVGSGVSTAAGILKRKLEDIYKYDVPEVIKLSSFIKSNANKVEATITDAPLSKRISSYQEVGNKLRQTFGNAILAKLAIRSISSIRQKDGFAKVKVGDDLKEVPMPRRRIYIVESLKHPEELAQLREVYGDIFWTIGVSAADHVRERRLISAGVERGEAISLLRRDMGESAEFGQKVRKAFASSDFFIRNDGENTGNIEKSVDRFLEILFGVEIRNPTSEESAMFNATSAAAKSACLSRQVGAALINAEGELISVGWNDVPRFGGGLYGEASSDGDNRCYMWREKDCHNDLEKRRIEDRIIYGIKAEIAKKAAQAPLVGGKKQVPVQLDDADIKRALESSGISSLIEFSRAIHAEMAAILSVARDKRHSLKGSSMVVTTYPCHNCARHIVAAGVVSVIYLEPYEKSLAIHLHPDAVSEDERDLDRVHFKQFQGFAPRHILDLFSGKRERKSAGRVIKIDSKTASPIYRRHLDSFTLYEDKVVHDVVEFA
ncbi:deaminase [Pseudoxanthomonas sp. LH2527]|uniref:anti-phage dCTP deaminase n=1 Tax=Pseudoxanthomonas sp. LH2527 TaxID=2923249 RepID=UPI001F12A52C|nr:anti-phage dCTP deaminase [Pseudoxanthomonas sp. LH2527]MCH6482800.1 deaminase [Pseudoxanthomonas sp. LH2527]